MRDAGDSLSAPSTGDLGESALWEKAGDIGRMRGKSRRGRRPEKLGRISEGSCGKSDTPFAYVEAKKRAVLSRQTPG